MGRQKPEYNGTSWQDVGQAVQAWEVEHGVRVACVLSFRHDLAAGACVEVVLSRLAGADAGRELCRVRAPFPANKGSGHAGAVMHTVFMALAEYERNPWLWGANERRRARGEA